MKIGDRAYVTTTGPLYSTYEEMAKEMNLHNWDKTNNYVWAYKAKKTNELVTIVAKHRHLANREKMLYGVVYRGHHFIIGERGLKRIKSKYDEEKSCLQI